MTVLTDIVLPRVYVLGSTVAYREAGPLSTGRAFSARER